MTEELSPTDRDQLEAALFAVFALIAGADGVVDAKEKLRFTAILQTIAAGADPVLAGIAESAIRGTSTRTEQPADDAALRERLRVAVALADARMSKEEAQRFRRGLHLLGTQLAQASGGGMLGLRARTSEDERRALTALAELLGV